MKNFKRIMAILISGVLAFSCLFVGAAVSAESELTTPNFRITPVSSAVKPGDTVRVDFVVNNNSGFWGAALSCKLDNGLSLVKSGSVDTDTKEDLLKYDAGKSFNSYITVSPFKADNTVTVVYSNSRIGYNCFSNGNIVSVYVKVDENANAGNYNIKFTNKQVLSPGPKIVTDQFEYVDAKITVDNNAVAEPVLDTPVAKLSADENNNVKVTWSKVENAQSYDIYKTDNLYQPYKKIATVDKNSLYYNDTDTPQYIDYSYMVRANYNDKFTYSKEVSITLKPNLKITSNGAYPVLTWATGVNASYYEVYRYEATAGKFIKLASNITTNTYTDTTALGCLEYKYYVKGIINNYSYKTSPTVKVASRGIHTFDESKTEVVLPTCEMQGYSKKYCTVCGKTVSTDYVDAKGHTPIESTKQVINPTCVDPGYTEYECSVCHQTFATDYVEPLGDSAHVPDESTKQVVEPTCTDEGYTSYTCSLCNTVYKTDIKAAKGHTVVLQNAKEPTCTEKGYTGDEYCTVCKQVVKQGEEIALKAHTVVLQNAKEATCTEKGYTGDEYCTVCKQVVKQGEEIAPNGHTLVVQNAKKATYFAKGFTGDKVCSVCGEKVESGKAIKKLKLKKPKITVKTGKKLFKVKYTKVKGATGFQLRYRIKGKWIVKKFKTKKTVTKTIKKLKSGKKYSVQIRAFVKKGKKTAYSAWTKNKKVKIK